jgi:hypothetical protein
MDRIHELRVFPRSPKLRLHPVEFAGVNLGIRRMAAPTIDLLGKVLCFNKHGKEQI